MIGMPVSVEEISVSRERRVFRQRVVYRNYGVPVISFTLNLPGEYKRSSASDGLFYDVMNLIRRELGEPVGLLLTPENAGIEAIFGYRREPEELKRFCVELEETHPAGRLLDLDVLTAEGTKLSRPEERRCMICGGPVSVCARSRAHGLPALKEKTAAILTAYTASRVSELAVDALLREAHLTPKPGLVDESSRGAHKDMDLALLENSARSLRPYFEQAVRLGIRSESCMEELTAAGREAEKTMYSVTGGVNTHKGAIYLLGLLASGYGAASFREGSPIAYASALAAAGRNLQEGSHGEAVRRRYGSCGPRAEAVGGFPNAVKAAERLALGEDPRRVLLRLMTECDDTNLLYRGGEEGLAFARAAAGALLNEPEEQLAASLKQADIAFTERGLSPGGCADLLACAMFCRFADRYFGGDVETDSHLYIPRLLPEWAKLRPEIDALMNSFRGDALLRAYAELDVGALHKSSVHGVGHVERTMLLGALVAQALSLSPHETELLLLCCSYHDVGRINDWEDREHGKRSADKMAALLRGKFSCCLEEEFGALCAAVTAHSVHDKLMERVADDYGLSGAARALYFRLAPCLKDADNLDRVRLNDLDIRHIRTPETKALEESAHWIFNARRKAKKY